MAQANAISPLPSVPGASWGDGGDTWGHPQYPPPYPYAWPWLPPYYPPRYGIDASPYPPPHPPYRHTWTGGWSGGRPYGPHSPTLPLPYAPPGPPPVHPYSRYPPRTGVLRPWPPHVPSPPMPYEASPTGLGAALQTAPVSGPSPFAPAAAAVAGANRPSPHYPSSDDAARLAASPQAGVWRASSVPFATHPVATSGAAAGGGEFPWGVALTGDWPHNFAFPDAPPYAQAHSGSASPAVPRINLDGSTCALPYKRRRLHSEGGVGAGGGGSLGPLLRAPALPAAGLGASYAAAAPEGGVQQPVASAPYGAHACGVAAWGSAAGAGRAATPSQPAGQGPQPRDGGSTWLPDWDWGVDLDLDLNLEAFLLDEEAVPQAAGSSSVASPEPAEAGCHSGIAGPRPAGAQALAVLTAELPPAAPPGLAQLPALGASSPLGLAADAPQTSTGPTMPLAATLALHPLSTLRPSPLRVTECLPTNNAATFLPSTPATPASASDPGSTASVPEAPLPIPVLVPDAAPTPPSADAATPPPEVKSEPTPLPKPVRVTVTGAAGEAPADGPRHSSRRRRRGGSGDSDEENDREGDEDGRRSLAEAAMVGGRVVGVFHLAPYLEGGRCIELGGAMLTRSAFERVGGSSMAKWYRSIKVLPEGCTLGRWLTRHGLPVLKGVSRNRKAKWAAQQGAEGSTGEEA